MDEDLRSTAKDVLIRYGGDAFPNLFRSAKGSIVVDDEGREILDFTSGQMCATLGHNHPAITAAITHSCETAVHMFSGMIPEPVVRLGKMLADWLPAPLQKSLFLNTGSESNEAALRLAKLTTGGYEVIGLGGSWHGTTGRVGGRDVRQRPARLRPQGARQSRDPGTKCLSLPDRTLSGHLPT